MCSADVATSPSQRVDARRFDAPHPQRRNESGAVLVLAFVLMIVGLVIIGGLTYAVSNDVNNSTHFKAGRQMQYAASSITNQAIQIIRFNPLLSTSQTLNASPPSYCWGNGPTSQLANIDGVAAISVWCSTQWNPTSASTRVVTLSTCLSSLSAAQCAATPLLQAIVTFDDYPAGVSTQNTGQCQVYCGASLTINSWLRAPNVPTVSSLGTVTGPLTGGTTVSITGTGFVNGSTVNFIKESGSVPTNDNVVLSASSVTYINATTLVATAPPITSGQTYFVTVTTPQGTSAVIANGIFTYAAVVPTLSTISANSGSAGGGTSLTLTGAGFVLGASVGFIEESGGTATSPLVEFFASNVTATSNTSITAVTPGVTVATTYFVVVTAPGGTSTYPTTNIFTFSPLVPTVGTISPTFGPASGGTTVTLTGSGFVVGSTVKFTQESNGHVVNGGVVASGTSVVVVSSNSITVKSPILSQTGNYFVTVTTPTGTSNNYPVFNAQ